MIPIFEIANCGQLPERILRRSQLDVSDVQALVKDILQNVRRRGDEALVEYTRKFDQVELQKGALLVSKEEMERAYAQVEPDFLPVLRKAKDNICAFHEKQKEKTWIEFENGAALGQLIRPLQSVGVYVPGGSAPLSSSVLMCALPAKVAGVARIVMATPPGKDGQVNPYTLVAAAECGIAEVLRVGGAQAIGALAYGTESLGRVDKIVGPGNIFVTNAKREVYGHVGIDMVAGPSEVLVLADDSANPRYVAADLLSQAEHDKLAAAMLVTDSLELAKAVQLELERQLAALPRREIAQASVENHGAILVCRSLDDCFVAANRIAPEHLELSLRDPFAWLDKVQNAGACFLGHYAPEPLGDYFAGPNHVLPTSGTARFFSPLSVQDFIKRSSVIYYSREKLLGSARDIGRFARAEGLEAHARSALIRLEEEEP